MKSKLSIWVVALGLALAMGGCESATKTGTPGTIPAEDANLIPAAKLNALKPGMTAGQVLELLGNPTRKAPFSNEGLASEVWVYRIGYVDSVTQVPTSMQEQAFFDPLTGQQRNIQVPVYQNQELRTYRTLQLLMVGGRLTERKAGRETVRRFD